jgi:hypothetical protein
VRRDTTWWGTSWVVLRCVIVRAVRKTRRVWFTGYVVLDSRDRKEIHLNVVCNLVVNTLTSYYVGPSFNAWPRDCVFLLRFLWVCFGPPGTFSDGILQKCHYHAISHFLQCILDSHAIIWQCRICEIEQVLLNNCSNWRMKQEMCVNVRKRPWKWHPEVSRRWENNVIVRVGKRWHCVRSTSDDRNWYCPFKAQW